MNKIRDWFAAIRECYGVFADLTRKSEACGTATERMKVARAELLSIARAPSGGSYDDISTARRRLKAEIANSLTTQRELMQQLKKAHEVHVRVWGRLSWTRWTNQLVALDESLY